MRAALPAVLVVLGLAGVAAAEDSAQGPAPAASPAPALAPASPKRMNLGPYRSVAADDPAELADALRYQENVEVRGKAMDARSLTAKLEWWMKDFEPMRGATPAGMSAPSIAEMGGYRPHVSDSIGHHSAEPVDFMPAIEWLTDKLNKKKKED
jgi:hypothetical protein